MWLAELRLRRVNAVGRQSDLSLATAAREIMEKTPKTFNARFEKEVHLAIASLLSARYGRDKTEAVSRAILEADARVTGFESPLLAPFGRGLADVVPLQRQAAESAELLRAHQESSAQIPERDRGFPVNCKHCGNQGRGATKFATICFECKFGGHGNQPSDCPVCTAGAAI